MFKNRIGIKSIKEGLDYLPDGIIIAKENGIILLANNIMYDLCYELSSRVLQNVYSFWETITEEHNKNTIKEICENDNPILIINNEVYEFTLSTIFIRNENFIKLKATNISELYNLQNHLIKKNKELIAIQDKIIDTKNSIEEITMENEASRAKIKMHNAMGTNITKMKRYLKSGAGDPNVLLDTWRKYYGNFSKNIETESAYNFNNLIKAANAISVNLIVNGKIPKSKKLNEVLIEILRESLINAVRHADASEMYLNIDNNETNYTISINNNGKKPKKEIVEGGGFATIRKYCEKINAKFSYNIEDEFTIKIIFPKMYL